jgi:hypothetical protein
MSGGVIIGLNCKDSLTAGGEWIGVELSQKMQQLGKWIFRRFGCVYSEDMVNVWIFTANRLLKLLVYLSILFSFRDGNECHLVTLKL